MKHIKLYEDFISEASTKHYHVIKAETPTKWWTGSDFSTNPADAMTYNMETADMIAKKEKATVYTMTDAEMKKAIKSFKANESTELDEALNEISLSSVGVKSFLTAMYTNADAIKKLGFKSFKDLVGYIKSNDLHDWDDLRAEVKELGIVITESLNEGKELTQEEYSKYYPILGHKGAGLEFNFNGQTIGGYVVPKAGDNIEALIAKIEKASKKKLTAIPYNQETGAFASGVGNDTWMKSGRTVIYLQIVKK
jgi:hypothetical protein